MTASAAPRTRRHLLINLAIAGVGGLLLFVTVREVGWGDVRSSLASLGWWFVAVLVLGGVRFAARARAWMLCAQAMSPGQTPPGRAGQFFAAVLAGDALGNLTPLGLLASEPAKAYFVSDRLSPVAAVSSVAAENAFYLTSVLLMIGAGSLVFFGLAGLADPLRLAAQSVLGVVMAGGIVSVWIARRQPAIVSRLARWLARWSGRAAAAPERLREVEIQFYDVLRWPAGRLARVGAWEAMFHVAAVAEVFMVLRLLPTGREITLLDAFVLETAGRLIVVVFKFVPYRLGVDEAGTALVARALALDPAIGVALALVRRIRILCWNAVGLLALSRARA